jgi:uncharacterized ferredoxin-like protein
MIATNDGVTLEAHMAAHAAENAARATAADQAARTVVALEVIATVAIQMVPVMERIATALDGLARDAHAVSDPPRT